MDWIIRSFFLVMHVRNLDTPRSITECRAVVAIFWSVIRLHNTSPGVDLSEAETNGKQARDIHTIGNVVVQCERATDRPAA